MPPPPTRRMVIVGAGIVGAAAAYFLSRAGHDVTVLEASAPAAGASGASDGAVSVASKRPGPLMAAARAGAALYAELADGGLLAGLFHPRATVLVAENDAEAEALEHHAQALASTGVETRTLSPTAFRAACPPATGAIRLAVAVYGEGHALGYAITHRLLAASGVPVLRGCQVNGFVTASSGHMVTGLETSHGPIAADSVIVAAGGGSAALLDLGAALVPRKGQLIVTERTSALTDAMPGSLMSCKYLASKASVGAPAAAGAGRRFGLVIDPLRTGQLLIGGSREETAVKANDIAAIRHLLGEAVRLVPAIAGLRIVRTFSGIRTATADGAPIVGSIPGRDNVFVATGFEGDGICLGPLMGRTIAALATGQPLPIGIDAFQPARFFPARLSA